MYIHVNIAKIYTVFLCIINMHSTLTYFVQTKTFTLDAINRD